MSVALQKHQPLLERAERVRIPLRRVSGGAATVWLSLLSHSRYVIGIHTSAPGFGSYCAEFPQLAYPNRDSAVSAGIMAMRRIWRTRDVTAMVDDLSDALQEFYT